MLNLFDRVKPDPSSIVTERWETKFFWKHRARFKEERTADYKAEFHGRELVLTLKRRNLFAWVNDPLYRYRDFVLEADISLDPESGYCSGGVLFRYVNESYYYFLVSTRGFFRFDVVFNGNPIRLIDWTKLPPPMEPTEQAPTEDGGADAGGGSDSELTAGTACTYKLLVVANGTRFTLCCDDSWIAEIDDETIDAGGIAFGAQNYDEAATVSVSLQRILIDSRGLDVETNHYRWREGIPVDPESRLRLARTLFAAENPTAAVIQVRKALKEQEPDAATLFFLAECQTALGLYDSALENVERSLELDNDFREAQHEKANLLYLLGRYLELRDYLKERVDGESNSTLWNLYGHAHFSLGNWQAAREAYAKASELEPEMPLFHINAARACEHLSLPDEALRHYLIAGRRLIRQDAMDDLARIIPAMAALDPNNREGRIFEGTVAFREGDFTRAAKLFRRLIEDGVEDSAVFYMLGLIRNREGDRRSALALYRRAAELESDFALYWFRVAETRYLLGEDPSEPLCRAIELGPQDCWIWNLSGQVALDEGRAGDAVEALSKAAAIAPEEIDIAVNYAEALFRIGKVEEAIGFLKERKEAEAFNALGNIYSRIGRDTEALACYERGYTADPGNPTITENYAAACIEADLVSRAEELLGKLVETSPSASVLNRVANLARIEGDLARAETAYRRAFSYLDLPDFDRPLSKKELQRLSSDEGLNAEASEVEANLAELYLQWFRFEHAKTMLDRLRRHHSSERVTHLMERLRSATEVGFSCAACGRKWWAPKIVEVPALVKLHGEPPADSPAGRCERCGKVYCVGCAVGHLRGNHFVCPDCDEYLKLNDDHLKYLVLKAVERSQSEHS